MEIRILFLVNPNNKYKISKKTRYRSKIRSRQKIMRLISFRLAAYNL